MLGGATRERRNTDLAELLALGPLALPHRLGDRRRARRTRRRARAYERPRVGLVAAKPAAAGRPRRAAARRARRRAGRRSSCRSGAGQRLGEVQVYDRGQRDRPLAARRRATRSSGPGCLGRVGCYAGRTLDHLGGCSDLVIVTVTLNAALDRTLTVPNFQLGQRHRASQVLTLAGGKGINVARALKRLERAGRRDRASPAAGRARASSRS